MYAAVEEAPSRPKQNAKIDPELEQTDRLCDVWAKDGKYGQGGGLHPLEVMRLLNEGEVIGEQLSDDEVMIIVDQSILRSPRRVRATIEVWYKGYGPAELKAKRLGISRSALYNEWRMSLSFLRGVMREKGLAV